VGYHFRVTFRVKPVAFFFKPCFQQGIVFYYAVVHDGYCPVFRNVWVSVFFGHASVRGPAGVGYCEAGFFFFEFFWEPAYFSHGLEHVDFPVTGSGHSPGIVSPVLKFFYAVKDYFKSVLSSLVTDYAAQKNHLGVGGALL